MNARDGHHPVWLADVTPRRRPPLDRDLRVDVAIVGAGITGLTTAYLLQRQGFKTAVLEAHSIGRGTSGHTTAHVTAVFDHPFRQLASRFGDDKLALATRAAREAIDFIEATSRELRSNMFLRVPAWRFTEDAAQIADLEQEEQEARKAGMRVSLVRDPPIPGGRAKAALVFEEQALFHPMRYLDAMAASVEELGGQLFEQTRAEEIEDGRPCRVVAAGHTVRADAVVHATHTPVGVVVSLQSRLGAFLSYVIAARVRGAVPLALMWDTMDPYHYVRPHSPGGDLVLIGGEDHHTGRVGHNDRYFASLEGWARERFDVDSIDSRWCAELFEPADGLPYIGRIPGNDHVYAATGFSGTGMTSGTLAAHVITDLIRGAPTAYEDLYSPGRVKPVASAPDFVRENAQVAWHLVRDRLKASDSHAASDVTPGQGRIVELDGNKAAVYRAPDGRLHVLSPVCTHLGCLVHWNEAGRTWDCPCHGSRFLPTGEVLAGPAVRPLSSGEE